MSVGQLARTVSWLAGIMHSVLCPCFSGEAVFGSPLLSMQTIRYPNGRCGVLYSSVSLRALRWFDVLLLQGRHRAHPVPSVVSVGEELLHIPGNGVVGSERKHSVHGGLL